MPRFELEGDRLHELVIDAHAAQAVVQPREDATRGAADDRTRGPEEHPADHDADGTGAETVLLAGVRDLLDLDLAFHGAIGDGGADDLDVLVGLVDLLDRLEELVGGQIVIEHERRQGLLCLLSHPSLPLTSGSSHGARRNAVQYGPRAGGSSIDFLIIPGANETAPDQPRDANRGRGTAAPNYAGRVVGAVSRVAGVGRVAGVLLALIAGACGAGAGATGPVGGLSGGPSPSPGGAATIGATPVESRTPSPNPGGSSPPSLVAPTLGPTAGTTPNPGETLPLPSLDLPSLPPTAGGDVSYHVVTDSGKDEDALTSGHSRQEWEARIVFAMNSNAGTWSTRTDVGAWAVHGTQHATFVNGRAQACPGTTDVTWSGEGRWAGPNDALAEGLGTVSFYIDETNPEVRIPTLSFALVTHMDETTTDCHGTTPFSGPGQLIGTALGTAVRSGSIERFDMHANRTETGADGSTNVITAEGVVLTRP